LSARRTALMRVWYTRPRAFNHSRTSASRRSEMEAFGGIGLRPRRAMPRTMCFSEASGCSPERCMSRSDMARTRAQSVLEVLEEDRLFMFRRFTKRDDSDLARCFRVDD